MGQDGHCGIVYDSEELEMSRIPPHRSGERTTWRLLSNEYLRAARKESDGAPVPDMENLLGVLFQEKKESCRIKHMV